jgi:DNA repair exonuclease SbcCD ATPase subunit
LTQTFSYLLHIYLDRFEIDKKKFESILSEKDKQINKEIQTIEKLSQHLLVANESKRAVKTFILNKFSNALDNISHTATELLSNIPNMKNASIYFENCKETKSGKIKNEVSGIVNKGSAINIPIKAISGGERTAIDLAVDLAVIDTIEKESGCGSDFFVIDEPFDGLDNVCREDCLSVLETFDTSKKIILVDHSDELKQMVQDKITVVKQNDVSFIQ